MLYLAMLEIVQFGAPEHQYNFVPFIAQHPPQMDDHGGGGGGDVRGDGGGSKLML